MAGPKKNFALRTQERADLVSLSPLRTEAHDLPLKIGDLAKLTHKTHRALRLYEELGLLVPTDRTVGGFRLYGRESVERVMWIGKLQDLGFTLQQIQNMLGTSQASGVPREAMTHIRQLFEEKRQEISSQIERLSQLAYELGAALTYLEGCAGCRHGDELSSGTVAETCGCCEHQKPQTAPKLLDGFHVHSESSDAI